MTRDLETSKFKINIKGLFWEAVLHSMARLGVSKVNPKFKVATAVVDAATRVMDCGFTSLLGVLNIFGIRRRDLDLEASKFKVLMTEVVTVRRGLEASKFKVSTVGSVFECSRECNASTGFNDLDSSIGATKTGYFPAFTLADIGGKIGSSDAAPVATECLYLEASKVNVLTVTASSVTGAAILGCRFNASTQMVLVASD